VSCTVGSKRRSLNKALSLKVSLFAIKRDNFATQDILFSNSLVAHMDDGCGKEESIHRSFL